MWDGIEDFQNHPILRQIWPLSALYEEYFWGNN